MSLKYIYFFFPTQITSKRLEKHFAQKGTITDVQLKYTKEGTFRHFAFIGYKTEEEADVAKEYFNNTYLDAYKIQVSMHMLCMSQIILEILCN